MKFLAPLAALIAITSAAPTSPSPSHALLTERATQCWSQDATDTTTTTSPLVADCQALAETSLPESWIPSAENNYATDIRNGTCGIKIDFRTTSNLAANEMVITSTQIRVAIQYSIEQYAIDGRVASTGWFACMLPGQRPLLGWAEFKIYNADE
ncbi:hypothetical protein OQA88_13339 [Cercophora sp. LCS_1]